MPTIAFFPWITIQKKMEVGECELIPLEISQVHPESLKDVIRIISTYHLHDKCKISSATLIKFKNKEITSHLSENEIEKVFAHAEAFAMGKMSEREYFSDLNYFNSDTFLCVVHNFASETKVGITMVSRRRDGEQLRLCLIDYFKVIKAPHVVPLKKMSLVSNLATSIMDLYLTDNWPRLNESIYCFLKANTDSNNVPLQAELMFLVGAFERILDIKGGNEKELVEKFSDTLQQVLPEDKDLPLSEKLTNSPKFKKSLSVRKVWIQDFFITRGDLAHGRKKPQYPSSWSPFKHLLLGSEIFPILLKIYLQKLNAYTLTEEDYLKIHFFDHRIRFQILGRTSGNLEDDQYGWHESKDRALDNWNIKRLAIRK